MVDPGKPQIDWLEVERRYRAGESERSIAGDLTSRGMPISNVAIHQHAKRGNWRGQHIAAQAANGAKRAGPIAKPKVAALQIVPQTDLRRQIVLEKLASGLTLKLAAISAGVRPETLYDWRRTDQDFAHACDAASAAWASSQVDVMNAAGDRGDWRASLSLLERHPISRDEYGLPQAAKGGNVLNVSFNVPWQQQPAIQAGSDAVVLIEHAPAQPQQQLTVSQPEESAERR